MAMGYKLLDNGLKLSLVGTNIQQFCVVKIAYYF